ncbi:MAG: MATE family efflux transporter [Candidatus Eisenbacteria sp.]|nr:MATE family efflux transporter [Candidatus Eisenbacteria bacterium]
MKRATEAILTEGPIGKTLARLTFPMILGLLSMTLFNLVDTFFIGQLGKDPLAAMGFTFPVIMMVHSIALGLGIGASSVVSRAIGRRDVRDVRRLSTHALVLSVAIVALFIILGELTIDPLFRLLGAPHRLLPLIREYMQIWYVGALFVVVPVVGNNLIRATGDTKTPGLIMAFCAALNAGLDPLLIFGLGPFPALGIAGGALATVLARAIGLLLSLHILVRRDRLVGIDALEPGRLLESWKALLAIGVPATLTQLVQPVSMGVITRMVAGFGTAAVAGFGVATRVEMLVLLVVFALSGVLVPFAGQNWGAGRTYRIARSMLGSYAFSMVWGVLMFLLFLVIGRDLAGLFNRDPGVIHAAGSYFDIIFPSLGFYGILFLSISVLNAMHSPLWATALSLTRMIGLYVPLAWLGMMLFGLKGLFLGGTLANVLTGALAAGLVYRRIRRESAMGIADPLRPSTGTVS